MNDTTKANEMSASHSETAEAHDMPSGYKRTEVGVVPQDWRVETLVTVAKVRTGPFGSALHERDYVNDGTPIITVEHLSEQGIVHYNLPLVSDADRSRLKNYALRVGDIVFSRVGSVDRNSLVSEAENGWLFSGRLLRVRTSETSICPPYLSYHFDSEPFKQRVREVAVGQTMASLNTQILNGLHIVLPPPTEQTAIAQALSDVDGLLGALEALIAKKRAIKQAAMQQLLTGKIRMQRGEQSCGYKSSELGLIPNDWQVQSLREGIGLFSGNHVFAQYCNTKGEGMPYLTGPADFPNGTITQTKFTMRPTSVCELNDILVTVKGSGAGTLIEADSVYCISRQLMAIRVRDWNVHFIFYSLLQNATKLKGASTGLIPGLSRSDILDQELPLPADIEEQNAIATVLSDMDAEIAALEQRRDKTRAIKQGMMQQLLTGRVRLVQSE